MERVLITGGAGFIGSHLCEYLIAKGYYVTAIDNFITGTPRNLISLSNNLNFELLEFDVTKPWPNLPSYNFILHFASPASPVDYYKYPLETLLTGSAGTYQALEKALNDGSIFMLASTSEVYGDPTVNPQPETYWGNVNPLGKRSVYDEAKRYAEALTMAYHRYHRLNVKIARIFNTYGPRMRIEDGRAIPNFIYQLLTDQPLTIYGDGNQTRSFCYISDLIEGIYLLMKSDFQGAMNLGNPVELKIIDLAKKIVEVAGKEGKLVFKELPEDDPKLRCPDISLAKKVLNWEPKVTLEEGLKATIEFFRQELLLISSGEVSK